jgi:dephospho-CoA kinase
LILIGLTGGIASGKSTVAALLEAKGGAIIDADKIAREILAPGTPAHRKVVERFGQEVLLPSGDIDRAKLGHIVFSDPGARADLESITHPEIYAEISRRLDDHRESDRVVVLDAALLVETMGDRGRALGLDALVVVAASVEDQVSRMMEQRRMPQDDARARMAAQSRQERKMALADYVIDNRGTRETLEQNVDLFWTDLNERFGA